MTQVLATDRRERCSFRSVGVTGTLLTLIVLGLVNAFAFVALLRLAAADIDLGGRRWIYVTMIVLGVVAIDVVYFTRRLVAPKYLIPGGLLLLLFQLYPFAYTLTTSVSNYGEGHILTKQQAIQQLVAQSFTADETAPRYSFKAFADPAGKLQLLLEDEGGAQQLLTTDGLAAFDPANATVTDDVVTAIGDSRRLNLRETRDRTPDIDAFVAKVEDGRFSRDSLSEIVAKVQTLRYDRTADRIVGLDGTQYRPVRGNYVAADGTELTPGYKVGVGFENFRRLINNERVRSPFLRVLAWNLAFAAGSVFLTVALGLLLAISLNHPRLGGKRLYRSVLIVPYALPTFMMTLVWSQGLLNQRYGFINDLLGREIQWLDDPWLARLSILVINLWLGFPYMFLLCTGLLQSIPTDLYEAARVDGASGLSQFRRITVPLLMIGLAPMLISSFAFNFNNAAVVLLSTRGGPPIPGSDTIAGQTDLLITYTYKVAFGSGGGGGDYAFASVLSIAIFVLVGTISVISFSQTKAFKEIK